MTLLLRAECFAAFAYTLSLAVIANPRIFAILILLKQLNINKFTGLKKDRMHDKQYY